MNEDVTQRIRIRPDAPTTAMPGPLDLAGSSQPSETDASTTDVLSLDELFDSPPPAPQPPAATARSGTAPTWTAMPVVPVRSEPMTPAPAGPTPGRAASAPPLGDRVRSDAAAAWDDTVRRTRAWLARDDNALTLLTALVAICLILAVAAFSR